MNTSEQPKSNVSCELVLFLRPVSPENTDFVKDQLTKQIKATNYTPTILAKSLGTLSQKHRKFAHPPYTPQCNVDLKGPSHPESLEALSTLLGQGGGGQ